MKGYHKNGMNALVLAVLLTAVLLATNAYAALIEGGKLTISLVNQDPDPAIAGDIVDIRIGIENEGDAVNEVVIELVEDYPFEMVSGSNAVQYIGTISGYKYDEDMKVIKFKVKIDKDVPAGTYELKILEYKDGERNTIRTQTSVFIDVKNSESAEVIYIDQVQLLPGEITPMKFIINNVGNAPLRDLTFYWENEDSVILPVGSDDTKFIKSIDVGESVELSYDVIASTNADPDLYKLSLSLSYADPRTGEETAIETSAGVYVGGETDFDVTYSGTSSGETVLSISNVGSVPADSVRITIPNQQGWTASGVKSVIIGNLNKGDYTVASFSVQQSNTNAGSGFPNLQDMSDEERQQIREDFAAARNSGGQPRLMNNTALNSSQSSALQVEIFYTDTRGIRHTVVKEVDVDLSSSSTAMTQIENAFAGRMAGNRQSSTNWTLIIIVVVAVVGTIVFYSKYQSGKRKDPNYTVSKMFSGMFNKKKKRK
ncbi:COG1361 S-layer family protein [Candidatus Woesearchaeota archaeon]|nr:COG1361 S-layer family protein [Candidatus Woesearchaeota archaeon]